MEINRSIMKIRTTTACHLLVFGLTLAWAGTSLGARSTEASSSARTTDANLARITIELLERSQFSHHPLDSELAGKLLDHYLDALDTRRSLFLQSDVDEFTSYTTKLPQALRGEGDSKAAQRIFARYLERLDQQTTAVNAMLRTEKFDFAGHDTYSLDWEHQARPKDAAAARQLWRQQLRAEYLQEKLSDKKAEQIATLLTRRHLQQLKTMRALGSNEILETYLGALAHVYDPHSNYLGHDQMESMSIAMNLSLIGIGASLTTVDGYCTIHELIPGGPGARSGLLKPGDRIIAVAQAGKEPVDVVNIPLSRIVGLIRGPKGSTVALTILPASGGEGAVAKTVKLVRDEIKLEDQEAKARIVDLSDDKGTTRVGIIDLPSFYADMGGSGGSSHRSATADVVRLLTKLNAERVRGVVLDLRRNGGGSLEEAISLTGLFIRKGPVVQTRDPSGKIDVEADTDPSILYDGPLVLLTSRFSASASEILAGALQDYGRAVVVGDPATFGKGTVQSILPLGRLMDQNGLAHSYDPGALLVTIRKFYRPSGASTQLRGVSSDIVLPSMSDFADINEASLQDPLPWDTIAPSHYDRLNRVQPFLAPLRERSSARVKADKNFKLLAESSARLKKDVADKSVSLNEAERRQEMAQAKALQEQLKKADRALLAKRPPTYEVTLANLSRPGLPPRLTSNKEKGTGPAKTSAEQADDIDDPMSEHSSADDIILNEAENIVTDYVQLSSAKAGADSLPAR